ncbi:MAG: hypothetical protein MKZ95_02460 [Pirellulales bacterium]|nr:hypothetical protein [Pirellulales bacterium]HCK40481.1 hypothetical protein [Planctomycetaceae bacterium]|tara:strand:+ start:173 stop:394 length:222 start_codon:yes stop_codon:yes gene_type:complete
MDLLAIGKMVKVVSTRTEPVGLYHFGREVGQVAKGSGTVKIKTKILGRGPVMLFGKSAGKSEVNSPALLVDIP